MCQRHMPAGISLTAQARLGTQHVDSMLCVCVCIQHRVYFRACRRTRGTFSCSEGQRSGEGAEVIMRAEGKPRCWHTVRFYLLDVVLAWQVCVRMDV